MGEISVNARLKVPSNTLCIRRIGSEAVVHVGLDEVVETMFKVEGWTGGV